MSVRAEFFVASEVWAEVEVWTPWKGMVSAQDVGRVGDQGVTQRRGRGRGGQRQKKSQEGEGSGQRCVNARGLDAAQAGQGNYGEPWRKCTSGPEVWAAFRREK